MKITKAWLIDTLERALGALVVTFFMTWLAPVLAAGVNNGDVPHAMHGILVTSVAWKAVLAGFVAAGIVVKSAIAAATRGRVGSLSPASFAAPVQPQQAIEGAPPPAARDHRRARRTGEI